MAEANNPFVVNLLEFNEDDGIPLHGLEYVAGDSLVIYWPSGAVLPRKRLCRSWRPWTRSMEAHERGIVHRDIKPSNIRRWIRMPATGGVDAANSFHLNGDSEL